MKKALLALLIIALTIPAFAGTSATFVNSIEVFGGGGADSSSSSYILHGKARGMEFGARSSGSFRFGDGFINSIYFGIISSPVISSIDPSSAYNTGLSPFTIHGLNFYTGATVRLIRIGQTPIDATNIMLINSGQIDCTFNLLGIPVGVWGVEVINTDGSISTLESALTVLPKAEPVIVKEGSVLNTPNPFNPDAGPTTIKYELTENAPIDLYIYNISGTRIWENHYPPTIMGGKKGVNAVLWTGYNTFKEKIPNGIYVYVISTGGRALATGKIAVFK